MVDHVEETAATTNSVATRPPRSPLALLAVRDFRLLWLGESISLLGDQFYLVALPWLTLQLTGSGFALGTVLMAAGIPRVVFMLVGGVIVDRVSPRPIMLASNLLRFALALLLAGLIFFHALQLWMLYVIAFGFGLVDAFFHPAYLAMMPRLIETPQFEAGNAVLQGTGQIMQFVGPAPAGVLITALGVSAAFGFDALTFLVAALAVLLIRGGAQPVAPPTAELTPISLRSIFESLVEGFRVVLADPVLPTAMMAFAGINFFLIGSLSVGVPTLSHLRFDALGAAGMGTMFSLFGGGALLGALIAGMKRPVHLGRVMMIIQALAGLALALMSIATSMVTAAGLAGLMGLGLGYVSVLGIATLQRNAPPDVLGRVMSMFMVVTTGLTPISNAIAGALFDVNMPLTFVGAGVMIALVAGLALTTRTMRDLA